MEYTNVRSTKYIPSINMHARAIGCPIQTLSSAAFYLLLTYE